MKKSDAHLIDLFKRDPKAAFGRIVVEYQDRIFNLCMFMLREKQDAQEAAQDVFVKAYRALGDFKPHATLYTWLYRITVNACIDYRRKAQRLHIEEDASIDEIASCDPSPEMICESKEATGLIQEALAALKPGLRAAILLREIEGLSYEEIAEVLQISIGTVKSRISRAREELRESLGKKN
jgi:RNA polymerase sigma-70 factor, ECF subfamily